MSTPSHPPTAGPSRPPMRGSLANPERRYTGPDRATLPEPRSAAEAERYFAQVSASEGSITLPPRYYRAIGIGGWVLGGVACVYMALFADFGSREHVFSPLRRGFSKYTNDLFTLSASERSMLGLDEPPRVPPLEDQSRPS